MLTQIGAKPESDFSEPMGMLEDCHKRIRFFLSDLVRLAEKAESGPLDGLRRNALERALRYFQESGPRHTADEEESLFPRMRALNDASVDEALAKICELEADHERANEGHAKVDAIGRRWLADGTVSKEMAAALREELSELSKIYENHLIVEDEVIFPLATKLLSNKQSMEIGREMAKRRGLSAQVVKLRIF